MKFGNCKYFNSLSDRSVPVARCWFELSVMLAQNSELTLKRVVVPFLGQIKALTICKAYFRDISAGRGGDFSFAARGVSPALDWLNPDSGDPWEKCRTDRAIP
jgi:hypothetical protein